MEHRDVKWGVGVGGEFLGANRLSEARPGPAALVLLDGSLCGP